MKKIIDVCCGSRMFWFDKENKDTVFMDNRELEDTLCDGRKLIVAPDVVGDLWGKLTAILKKQETQEYQEYN